MAAKQVLQRETKRIRITCGTTETSDGWLIMRLSKKWEFGERVRVTVEREKGGPSER